MKKELTFLILGMILVVIGTLLKINHNALGQYFLIAGLAIEAFILASIVIKSLKK
jgi:hypothetical protein